MKIVHFVVAGLLGLATYVMPTVALAQPGPSPTSTFTPTPTPTPTAANYRFDFSAVCDDCTEANDGVEVTATGSLFLQNYVLGNALNSGNFVSFTYNGTNLAPMFTLNSVDYIFGQFFGSGPANVGFGQGGTQFSTAAILDGEIPVNPWNLFLLGSDVAADFGIDHDWNANVLVDGGVPEPATWAMLLLGFGALGAALRRRIARPVTA